MPTMIIANRLVDGLVVFQAAAGEWTETIADGQAFATESGAEAALATALADPVVIDPCLIEIENNDSTHEPVAIRESIRAHGPTIEVESSPHQQKA